MKKDIKQELLDKEESKTVPIAHQLIRIKNKYKVQLSEKDNRIEQLLKTNSKLLAANKELMAQRIHDLNDIDKASELIGQAEVEINKANESAKELFSYIEYLELPFHKKVLLTVKETLGVSKTNAYPRSNKMKK